MTSKSKHTSRSVLEKIVINAGVGRFSTQPNFEEKILPQMIRDLGLITGQKPRLCKAKKSIATFKIREGQVVGLQITLRRKRMIDFFDRLIRIILPRVKDFHGLNPKIIDKHGVLNIGFRDQMVFPEINLEESLLAFPLGVNLVPKSKNHKAALEAYYELGIPLKK